MTLTPVAERLTVELSQSVLLTKIGFRELNLPHMRGYCVTCVA